MPSAVAREDEAVRKAMLAAVAAIATRNEALRQRVLGATSRLRRMARNGRPASQAAAARGPVAWRRAG
jgi:hypothetical protein